MPCLLSAQLLPAILHRGLLAQSQVRVLLSWSHPRLDIASWGSVPAVPGHGKAAAFELPGCFQNLDGSKVYVILEPGSLGDTPPGQKPAATASVQSQVRSDADRGPLSRTFTQASRTAQ